MHSTPYPGFSPSPTKINIVAGTLVFLLLGLCNSVAAFDKLNAAQTWVYDTSHLANTSQGQIIDYRYQSRIGAEQPIEDTVRVSINKEHPEGRRDVSLDFLTGERQLALPEFTKFRGNPVIIATLEHIAQFLAADSGGGVLYFRNRIRDALAADMPVLKERSTINNTEIDSIKLQLQPLADDPRVGQQPTYSNALITIVLSEAVPGGVVSVGIESASDNEFFFGKAITIN